MSLMLTSRLFDIIGMKYDLQRQQRAITQKIIDRQKYASNIGDGAISMSDMMNTPASLFQRSFLYMTYAHNASVTGAKNNMEQMMMLPNIQAQMTQMKDARQQDMYRQWIFKSLYQQQREQFAKIEANRLNEEEKELQKQKTNIDIQLKMLEEEYTSTKQAISDSAKNWKPEYVA